MTTANETTQANAPAFPTSGPSFVIRLEIGATAMHLATWLQHPWVNRWQSVLTNADGSPLDTDGDETTWRHWEIAPVAVRETDDISATLHNVLTTWRNGRRDEAEQTAIVRYALLQLPHGPAPRCKLSIRAWPVLPAVFEYVASVLSPILRDSPQARDTLVHYVLYAEGELPDWMIESHRGFFTVLKHLGSHERSYVEDHIYRYPVAVNEAKRAARDDPAASTGPAAEAVDNAARDQPAGGIGDEPQAGETPDGRARAKQVRHAKLRRLFYEENRRDLTIAQMARQCNVTRRTIQRDLRELGLTGGGDPP